MGYCSSGLSRNLQLQTCTHSTCSHICNVCRLPLIAFLKNWQQFILVAAYFLDSSHICVPTVPKGVFLYTNLYFIYLVWYMCLFLWMCEWGCTWWPDKVSDAFLHCPPSFLFEADPLTDYGAHSFGKGWLASEIVTELLNGLELNPKLSPIPSGERSHQGEWPVHHEGGHCHGR